MSDLIGHTGAVEAFTAAVRQGRMHHAWLIFGPRGIGKARFADEMALRYLAGQEKDNRAAVRRDHAAALIRAGAHPDHARLARLPKEKTGDLARSITIAQVRALQGLFATSASFSPRRVVVIDAIDDMERPAANALLKNLEEPPAAALFLLVSHAPGRLLPTIRSRCRPLRLGPLDQGETRLVLERERPDLPENEISTLARVAEGAPGRALRFAGLAIAELDATLAQIMRTGDRNARMRTALSRELASKAAQPRYEAFLDRLPGAIAARARALDGMARAEAIVTWETARALAEAATRDPYEPQATAFELLSLLAALAPSGGVAKAR